MTSPVIKIAVIIVIYFRTSWWFCKKARKAPVRL